jgi:hypothetical protein
MQKPKSVEKTTIGNNAGQEYMAGKHKKRQSLDLHSLSRQVQQQHPLHSHMCKPIDAPSSFKVLLVRSTVVNPRNERLETQNTKGFKKGDKKVYSNLSIIINNKNNTRISKTLISKKTLFINKMQSPKRIEKTLEFGCGGAKGQGRRRRRRCKEELQKTKKPRTHIPMF